MEQKIQYAKYLGMRIFYEAWCSMFENRPLSADDLQNSIIPVGDKGHIEIRPLTTDELPPAIEKLIRRRCPLFQFGGRCLPNSIYLSFRCL